MDWPECGFWFDQFWWRTERKAVFASKRIDGNQISHVRCLLKDISNITELNGFILTTFIVIISYSGFQQLSAVEKKMNFSQIPFCKLNLPTVLQFCSVWEQIHRLLLVFGIVWIPGLPECPSWFISSVTGHVPMQTDTGPPSHNYYDSKWLHDNFVCVPQAEKTRCEGTVRLQWGKDVFKLQFKQSDNHIAYFVQ